MEEKIEVYGARVHNLKNIDVTIPRNKLVVITGISGSGKSSLAFDTLYAEGQRRYMESFSAYARSFLGKIERPDVDKIEGLSPVISIEQKTTSRNPRSTVGTVTEVYDFLRLLYARAGEAFSYVTGEKMIQQSDAQIVDYIIQHYSDTTLSIFAPLIRGRKGHYRELFTQIRKQGFNKVRIDGELSDLKAGMQLDRYKIHDIEVLIDRININEKSRFRLTQSVQKGLEMGKGLISVTLSEEKTRFFSQSLMCPSSGIAYDDPAPNMFSFNSAYGACPTCKGLGRIEKITEESILPDRELSISRGGIVPLGEYREIWFFKKIEAILKKYKLSLSTPIKNIPEEVIKTILYGDEEKVAVASTKYPGTDWQTKYEGVIPYLERQYTEGNEKMRLWLDNFHEKKICPTCEGGRLKKEALHFRIDGHNISELAQKNLWDLSAWLEGLEARLGERQNLIAQPILKELRKRLGFLLNVGLEYLTLNRAINTLSGGETQRIRLATQVGTQLTSVLYILDEPSIGLHQRDNTRLIQSLKDLRDLGNTVIVVEHDKDIMLASDYILDIGPEAGKHGGHIVAAGKPEDFVSQFKNSVTARYLKQEMHIEVPKERRKGNGKYIVLEEASGNNLKSVTLSLPLGKMIAITGVSGSGKSSLIHQTLFPIIRQHLYKSYQSPLPHKKISGLEHIDKVIEIDQSPIGRTPRSNPATYTGVFTDIRNLFKELPESKIRGYAAGRFSFNVKGGRCETCEGAGMKTIEMDFLPDVLIECESCRGRRYNRETLEVRYKGKSISDVLDLTIAEAVDFFENQPKILRKIKTLLEVGLGYLTLGQQAPTLSGGEAQRVKLASELSKKATGKTLYILDEPTTGLHFKDIQKLLTFLQKLVDQGNTVLTIEHNLDVIKVCDHVIDLGPEGGERGGQILYEGTPEQVAKGKKGYTGKYLKKELL